jgi:hypothetical protein
VRRFFLGWLRLVVFLPVHYHWSNEPIAASVQSLYETRGLGGVGQCGPQFVHRSIETAVEVNERVVGPKHMAQFIPGDYLTGMLEQ